MHFQLFGLDQHTNCRISRLRLTGVGIPLQLARQILHLDEWTGGDFVLTIYFV